MKRDEFLESPGRISQPELREVFGDEMPIAVAELLMKPRDGSIRELRAAIADLPGCVWEPATRPDTTGLELVAPDQHVGANAPARTNDTELTSLRAERDALKLKVERLVKALRPFHAITKDALSNLPDDYEDDRMIGIEGSWGAYHSLQLRDLREADEAIKEAGKS